MMNKALFHRFRHSISVFSILSVLFFTQACTGSVKTHETEQEFPETQTTEHRYTSGVFRNQDASYGYEIRMDGDAVIRQNTVPAMEGNAGFADSSSALRMSEFVLYKLQNGHFPPSVSRHETDSILKIIK